LRRCRELADNTVAGVTRSIRTYSLAERAMGPDFGIHDEKRVTRIEQAHRHEYFQIQVNLSGRTLQHIGARSRPLVPGSLSFVLPYRVHRVPHPPGSRFFVINFRPRFLRPDLDVDALDLEDVPLARAPELAPFLFQEFMDFRLGGRDLGLARAACIRMAGEHARRRLCSTEIIRGELLLLLALVCRRHESAILRLAAAQAQRKGRRDALSRVIRHIRGNLARRLSLAGAAAAADLSPNYLAHLIKKETGRTFVDLVTERRMERAQELLAHTTLRIAEVAAAAGFDDEAYFARRFRQCFRVAPRDYRLQAAAGR
jgi:AraC-like DNA-binding protein